MPMIMGVVLEPPEPCLVTVVEVLALVIVFIVVATVGNVGAGHAKSTGLHDPSIVQL